MATTAPAGGRGTGGTLGSLADWVTVAIGINIVTGVIASFMDPGDTQAILFSLATIAASIAAGILTFWHAAAGRIFAAAGFATLGVVNVAAQVAGYTGDGPESVFGNVSLLFAPGLILIAAQNWSPTWARAAAGLAALLFAVWSYSFILGDDPVDIESPLLIIAFLSFIVAQVGWVLTLRAEAGTSA